MTLSELEQVRALLAKGFANGKYYDREIQCYCIAGAALTARFGDTVPQAAFVRDPSKSINTFEEIAGDLGFTGRDEMMLAFDRAPTKVVKLLEIAIRNRQ